MLSLILVNLFLVANAYTFNDNNATVIYPCKTDRDCSDFQQNGLCLNHVCVCEDGNDCGEKVTVKRVKGIGQRCSEREECVINDSDCTNNTCECNPGFVASSTTRECFRLVETMHSYCMEDVQCEKLNGICSGSKCICANNTVEMNGGCLRNIGIDSVCYINDECTHIKNSHCVGGRCTCKIGHVGFGKYKCLLQAELLDSDCEQDVQCTSTLGTGSACLSNRCQCKYMYHYKKRTNECVRDLLLGETCSKHEDCHQPGHDPSRLECILGECHCKYPFYEDQNYCISGVQFMFPHFICCLLSLIVTAVL